LLPGESREITARFAAQDAGNDEATLEVGGWNVEGRFDCVGLAAAPVGANNHSPVRPGESVTVTANISNTFLDGSRVPLRLDGEVVDAQWAWARGDGRQTLTFRVPFGRPGRHVSRGQRLLAMSR
jgi:hypothetical protein